MWALIPALAEYAEIDAPAFPDESSTISDTFIPFKAEIIMALPLSLKEPVGFINSILE